MSKPFANTLGTDLELGRDSMAAKNKAEMLRKVIKTREADVKKPVEDSKDIPEKRTSAIDEIVGEPFEDDIPVNMLYPVPKEWNCFPTALEDDVLTMCASISKYGLFHRITLWQTDTNKYMILGGNTRTTCFRKLFEATEEKKWLKIPALIYKKEQLTEIDANRIFLVSNTDQRKMSTQIISTAYCDLMKLEKKNSFYGSGIFSRDAAAKQAKTSSTSFSRYLHLSNLIQPLMDEIDKNNITIVAAYELSFLPQPVQTYIYEHGLYIDMSTQAARELKLLKIDSTEDVHEACALVDERLKELKAAPKRYKYKIEIKTQLSDDMKIVPFVMPKERSEEFVDRLEQAVKESNYAEDLKKDLLKALGCMA